MTPLSLHIQKQRQTVSELQAVRSKLCHYVMQNEGPITAQVGTSGLSLPLFTAFIFSSVMLCLSANQDPRILQESVCFISVTETDCIS